MGNYKFDICCNPLQLVEIWGMPMKRLKECRVGELVDPLKTTIEDHIIGKEGFPVKDIYEGPQIGLTGSEDQRQKIGIITDHSAFHWKPPKEEKLDSGLYDKLFPYDVETDHKGRFPSNSQIYRSIQETVFPGQDCEYAWVKELSGDNIKYSIVHQSNSKGVRYKTINESFDHFLKRMMIEGMYIMSTPDVIQMVRAKMEKKIRGK